MLDRLLGYLPYVVFVGAITLAVVFSPGEGQEFDRTLGAIFVLLLGGSSLLFGLNAVRRGAVRVKRACADRFERPAVFWATVLIFRVGIGLALVIAGVWLLWTRKT